MLPTIPVWQAAHGFGSEQNKNGNSTPIQLICFVAKVEVAALFFHKI